MKKPQCVGKHYSTAQIATAIGVHPNTIRFYEEMELLPKVARRPNGYRIFTDIHLTQLRLIRVGFRSEILGSDLRQRVIDILKTTAAGEVRKGLELAVDYSMALAAEKDRAEEAIQLAERFALGTQLWDGAADPAFTRREAADTLGISVDALRHWERNGLLTASRTSGGKPRYRQRELERLKIIRVLRGANYSTMSIHRMLRRMDMGDQDVKQAIDTPGDEEDIVRAADRYITALTEAEADAQQMISIIQGMWQRISN